MAEENTKDDQNNSQQKKSGAEEDYPTKDEWEKLVREVKKDLDTDPKYLGYFDKFESESVNVFKNLYTSVKVDSLFFGQKFKDEQDEYETMFSDMAEEKLWQIQQRKLFDIYIRWRAGLIKVKEVQITKDFEEWSERIQVCPFISPISQDEFDLYMSFIQSTSIEEINHFPRWQRYEDFKKQYNNIEPDEDDEIIPEWYLYYEMKTGLSSLYMLEDVKGNKEKFYCQLGRDEMLKDGKMKDPDKLEPEADNRQRLIFFDNERVHEFIDRFEDAKTKGLIDARIKAGVIEEDWNLNHALKTLQYCNEKIPVEFNEDWRHGIIETANNYIKKNLIIELPKAYQRYLFRIKNGLGYYRDNDEDDFDLYKDYREMILKGRGLNGEPMDFNF